MRSPVRKNRLVNSPADKSPQQEMLCKEGSCLLWSHLMSPCTINSALWGHPCHYLVLAKRNNGKSRNISAILISCANASCLQGDTTAFGAC